jgi:hypothetical protein
MKDTTRRPFDRATSISGRVPMSRAVTTREGVSFSNMPGQRRSELQLPPRMDLGFSMRQLHSIMRVISPAAAPGVPSRRRRRARRLPNSRKSAEPYPRQTSETGRSINASRNRVNGVLIALSFVVTLASASGSRSTSCRSGASSANSGARSIYGVGPTSSRPRPSSSQVSFPLRASSWSSARRPESARSMACNPSTPPA